MAALALALGAATLFAAAPAKRPGVGPAAAQRPARKAQPRERAAAGRTLVAVPGVSLDELRALDSALDEFAKEQGRSPMVEGVDRAATQDEALEAFVRLDEALSKCLTRSGARAAVDEALDPADGLTSLLVWLDKGGPRSAQAHATPGPAARAPVASPPARIVVDSSETPASSNPDAVVYVLTKVLVSRDGGPEEEKPVGAGGKVMIDLKLAHQAGSPPVQLDLDLSLPAAIVLGQSTQLSATARAVGAETSGELVLLGEVMDDPRAAPAGSERAAITASGQVTFSFLRRVGGVFAYQQTFAGALISKREPRSILLNWTDREPSIELSFGWSTLQPAVRLAGRAVYAPVRPSGS